MTSVSTLLVVVPRPRHEPVSKGDAQDQDHDPSAELNHRIDRVLNGLLKCVTANHQDCENRHVDC